MDRFPAQLGLLDRYPRQIIVTVENTSRRQVALVVSVLCALTRIIHEGQVQHLHCRAALDHANEEHGVGLACAQN